MPEDKGQATALQKRAARYTVIDGALYRRSFSKPCLRCVSSGLVDPILIEVHEGVCGGHPGGRSMEDKIIHIGYYWPNLRKDAQEYSQKYDKCQRYADTPYAPAIEQTVISPTWPFDMWGMDLIGPLPTGPGQVNYVIIAVDYFTKWIEAKAIKNPTADDT